MDHGWIHGCSGQALHPSASPGQDTAGGGSSQSGSPALAFQSWSKQGVELKSLRTPGARLGVRGWQGGAEVPWGWKAAGPIPGLAALGFAVSFACASLDFPPWRLSLVLESAPSQRRLGAGSEPGMELDGDPEQFWEGRDLSWSLPQRQSSSHGGRVRKTSGDTAEQFRRRLFQSKAVLELQ